MIIVKKKLLPLLMALTIFIGIGESAFGSYCYAMDTAVPTFNYVAVGYSGGYVRAIQRFLTCYSSTCRTLITAAGGIDGSFGSGTQDAVEAFQSCENLSATGQVNSNTWTVVDSLLFSYNSSTDNTTGRHTGYDKATLSCYYSGSNVLYYIHLPEGYCQISSCNISGVKDGASFHTQAGNVYDY